MPYFTDIREAKRYARNRPYFHPLTITRAKEALGIEGSVGIALDVACGTGQSAAALTSVADMVIGLDISWGMLTAAMPNKQIRYVQARAEAVPFPDGLVPVLSCALAIHWFAREQFLGEAWRILSDEGLLLIYNNGFTGIMREDPAFQNWSQKVYGEHFPAPARDSKPLTPEEAAASGFVFIDEEKYENEVRFTPEELVAYLATQTNVVAAVVGGRESIDSASRWLLDQVRPYFPYEKATFIFRTKAWYLRKGRFR